MLVLAVGAVAVVVLAQPGDVLAAQAKLTLLVFIVAVALWVATRVDETLIALAAALVLVLAGALGQDRLFASLGDPTIWLFIAAFVLAAGVSATGLPVRVAAVLISRAGSVRQLAHLVTVALTLTAFAVPATSGRAALAVPVATLIGAGLARLAALRELLGQLDQHTADRLAGTDPEFAEALGAYQRDCAPGAELRDRRPDCRRDPRADPAAARRPARWWLSAGRRGG